MTQAPTHVTASIDKAAIAKVTRFFDASTVQIVDELLQNARRSGATQIDIKTEDGHISITDNGTGVPDPTRLLAFGGSGWTDGETDAEDPAGMGFFALARIGGTIVSKTAGAEGWQIDLKPEHFVGTQSAAVTRAATELGDHGTQVTFRTSGKGHWFLNEIQHAVEHFPVPVTLNGNAVPQTPFLEEAVQTEDWENLTIGIIRSKTLPLQGEINFHGLVIYTNVLPQVYTRERGTKPQRTRWSTRIEVNGRSGLELVLPARRDVIQNKFLAELVTATKKAIFRAIKNDGESWQLNAADWLEAKELGINLPQPVPELHQWAPRNQDGIRPHEQENRAPETVPRGRYAEPVIMLDNVNRADEHALARALQLNPNIGPFYVPAIECEGYEWYEKMNKVVALRAVYQLNGRSYELDQDRWAETPQGHARPDLIEMVVTLRKPDGTTDDVRLETDIAFRTRAISQDKVEEELQVLLNNQSTITTEELTKLAVDAYFSPYLGDDSDSGEMQKLRFERACRKVVTTMTRSADEARDEELKSIAKLHLGTTLVPGEAVTVKHDGLHVHVAISRTELAA